MNDESRIGVIECAGCEKYTIVALKRVHHDGHSHHANSYCRECEKEDPLNRLYATKVNLGQSDTTGDTDQ